MATNGDTVSIALVGSGGDGIMIAGDMVLRAAAEGGWFGLITRSVGPQIRGGESLAFLNLSNRPIETQSDRLDILVALDWQSLLRFTEELPLDGNTLIIGNSATGEAPDTIRDTGARIETLNFNELVKAVPGGRANTAAVGAVASLIAIPPKAVALAIEELFGRKGAEIVASSVGTAEIGAEAVKNLDVSAKMPATKTDVPARWMINGNDAVGLGALKGGVRFVAAYPITPATEVLEWMAPNLTKVGGVLVQAEDELASINMAIGASYGGTPSLTATSGPGLALMVEGIGLAITAEVPVVVVDVMRGAPSTGIPTNSEQSDLNIAIYGISGDAPHVVVAPNSIADCMFTTQWAVHLAEAMQTAAIVLSDQQMGQSRAIVTKPAEIELGSERQVAVPGEAYNRYLVTDSGVSPMALPGTPGGQYTADGLEHTPHGTPSSSATDHTMQLDKRLRKIADFDYGDYWAEIDGAGDIVVITVGSTTGPVFEAARRLDPERKRIKVISLRLLAPAQPDRLTAVLEGANRVLVVEQNHGGQLYHYLRSHYGLDDGAEAYYRPGPLPFRPNEIQAKMEGLMAS